MKKGVRPVIIKHEDGHTDFGYVDLLSVTSEKFGDEEVFAYTVTTYPPEDS